MGFIAVDERSRHRNSEAMGSGNGSFIMTCCSGKRGLRGAPNTAHQAVAAGTSGELALALAVGSPSAVAAAPSPRSWSICCSSKSRTRARLKSRSPLARKP